MIRACLRTLAASLFALVGLCMATECASAQPVQESGSPSVQPPPSPGRTAASTAGQTGQRQSREQLTEDLGIEPMARIGSRVQNRVQNRIRNRIDSNYDPRANATSPFAVAEDQQRTAGQPRRRR